VQRDLFSDAELEDSNEKLPDSDRFSSETRLIGDYPFENIDGNPGKSNLQEVSKCL
jgi:hypothetical protein